jgi:hypothetical protein
MKLLAARKFGILRADWQFFEGFGREATGEQSIRARSFEQRVGLDI